MPPQIKDILVDNTVAKNFCNPLDSHYKAFIEWLFNEGTLVVTQRLLSEYFASCGAATSSTSIPVIVNRLLLQGRLRKFVKDELVSFRFPKRTEKRLRCNRNDRDNLKAVLLSARKYAVSHDDNFRYDVNNFPGIPARAERRPQDLPYSS